MIVNKGKDIQAYLLKADTTTLGYPIRCAIGTGTTGEALTDTVLGTEVYRVAFSSGYPTVDTTNHNITFRSDFSITASYNISEIGLLTAASAGNLFNRKTYGAIPVANGDTLTFDVTIQYCPIIRCHVCRKLLSVKLWKFEIYKKSVHICSVTKKAGIGRNIHAVVYERADCEDALV